MKKLAIFSFLFLSVIGYSQTLVSGVILNTTSQPLSGIVITEKGTTNNSVSDKDGRFTIAITNLVDNKYLLAISQDGYYYSELSGFGYETKPIIELIRTDENWESLGLKTIPEEKSKKKDWKTKKPL